MGSAMTDTIERFSLYHNKIGTPGEMRELFAGRLTPSLRVKWIAEMDARKARADEILGAALRLMDKEGLGNQAQSEAISDLYDTVFGGEEEISGALYRRMMHLRHQMLEHSKAGEPLVLDVVETRQIIHDLKQLCDYIPLA
jgi:hypothetical protein